MFYIRNLTLNLLKINSLFFLSSTKKADTNYLNKIVIMPEHTIPYFGSYSPELNLLTVIKFSLNDDVIEPFYELETSSTSRALKIGASIKHKHMTYHFEGNKTALNIISKSIFNITLDNIETALP